MVNPGGPSRGCVTCIQRKIGCDRRRPVCGQCQKSNRQCEGYRNSTDLMFRGQSQTVFSQGNLVSCDQATLVEGSEHPENSDSLNTKSGRRIKWLEPATPAIISSPKLTKESGLINFFANNFICNDSSRGSNLFWVPNNFDELLKEDCARLSVQSVGAMALARLHRMPFYYREAQKNYGLALLSLPKFWPQHVEIVKDAVLVTILFLGFFEILASYDSSSRRSWTTHLEGLGQLMNRREEQFLRGGFGARMLMQSRSQAILNALQTKTSVGEAFRTSTQRIHHSMSQQLVQSDHADMLLIRLANLQAQHQLSGPSDVLISELTALAGEFHQWTKDLPPLWSFSPQSCESRSNLWWEARYDIYPSAVITHVWNKTRAAQIIIYDLIQEMSLRLPQRNESNLDFSQHQSNYETMDPKVRNLVIDICATVPIHYRPSSATANSHATMTRPPLGTTYWLLWAMEVVGSMREASVHLTEWVIQCLEWIFELTGIVKAQLVVQRLQGRHSGIVAL